MRIARRFSRPSRKPSLRVIAGVVACVAAVWSAPVGAADFGEPPDKVVVPAPSAAGPGGVPDDEPGNNINERADTAAQANGNSMSDADRQVMKAIRDGVHRPPPAPPPSHKSKRPEKPHESNRP